MYQSEPITKLIRITKVVAYLHLFIAAARVIVMAVLLGAEGYRLSDQAPLALLALFLDFVLPAALLLWFANRVKNGAVWAGYAILGVAILDFVSLFIAVAFEGGVSVGFTLACFIPIGLAVKLPSLYLVACCLSALPELRYFRRNRDREQKVGGFPVIISQTPNPSSMAGIKPPPPATSIRRKST